MRCHYCSYEDAVPDRCEKCGSRELLLEGLGTEKLEETLMREGIQKFADPQKALLKLIADKRAALGAKK